MSRGVISRFSQDIYVCDCYIVLVTLLLLSHCITRKRSIGAAPPPTTTITAATSRRRRKENMARGRVKRQQVAAEDGWTVITHGLSNVSLDDDHQKSKGRTTKTNALSTIPGPVSGLTPAKLLVEFKTLQERWEDTLLARQVDDVFSGRKEHDGSEEKETEQEGNGDEDGMRWGVTEAVCIGIGSFSRDWAHRWRSLWQLVLFVDVVGKCTFLSAPLPIYATRPLDIFSKTNVGALLLTTSQTD